MKQTMPPAPTRPTERNVRPDPSVGKNAVAIAPPACGIDFVDRGFTADAPCSPPVQLQGDPVEEELLQGKFAGASEPVQLQAATARAENRTGLPASLKSGIESLSGYDMSDVRVHLNSSKPAPLHALAYAQGTDIHVAPGQERHLPHEAWHVVQQAQGRVSATLQAKGLPINDSPTLEREADTMGSAAVARGNALAAARGSEPPVDRKRRLTRGQRPARPVAQRTYAGLDPVNQARVDALADRDYADKAAEFEQRLGHRLAEAPEPLVAVNAMLDRVKAIVDAWADHTAAAGLTRAQQRQHLFSVYENEFAYEEGDKYFGAFVMTGTAIKKVFHSRDRFGKAQPARKKLKTIYNAIRNNNLAKWLKVAADEIDEQQAALMAARAQIPVKVLRPAGAFRLPGGGLNLAGAQVENVQPGFAHDSGLDAPLATPGRKAAVSAASAREKQWLLGPGGAPEHLHIAAPDMFSGIARGAAHEAQQIDVANRDRLYDQNQGVDYAHQETVTVGDVPDLTADEIRLLQTRDTGADPGRIGKSDKRAFKAQPNDKISWEQGREAISVMLNSQVDRAAAAIGARLEAGVSGSTGMMYAAAKNLGLGALPMLQRLRLAMLGWMLPNHDHSFYEIMRAAEIQGVPFDTDPMNPGIHYEEQENYRPMPVAGFQNLLPQNQFPRFFIGGGHKDALSGALPGGPATLAGLRAAVGAMGLPAATTGALDARALAELSLLDGEIAGTNFRLPLAFPANRAANRLLRRHLRERPSFRYLARRFPVHAEMWFGLLMTHNGKPLDDGQQLITQAGTAADLTALGAGNVVMRGVLTGAGLPAELVQHMPEHMLHDLIQLNAIIGRLNFNNALPWSNVVNQAAAGRLAALPQVARVRQVLGRAVADVAIGRLLAARHNEAFERAFHGGPDTNPDYVWMLAQGLPDSLARRVLFHPHGAGAVTHIRQLSIDIGGIAAMAPAAQVDEVQELLVTHNAQKNWFDARFGAPYMAGGAAVRAPQYDLVVAALAHHAGIDISADRHFKALASAARSQATTRPIVLAPGHSGISVEGLTIAGNQRTANLATVPVATRAATAAPFLALAQEEVASIYAYSRLGGMGAWQSALDQLDTRSAMANNKLIKLAPKIEAAISGLRKLPVAPGPVYAAARMDLAGDPVAAMRQFWPGRVVNIDNFQSSSKTIADSFIDDAGYGVAYEIVGLRTGRDIQMLSYNFGEREVLFPPGSRFKVVAVDDRSADPAWHHKVWVRMVEL